MIRPNIERPDWPTLSSLGLTMPLPKDPEGKAKALHKAQEDALRPLRKGCSSNSMDWVQYVSDLRNRIYEEEVLEDGTLRATIPWICQDFFDEPERQYFSITMWYGAWHQSPKYLVRYVYLSFAKEK